MIFSVDKKNDNYFEELLESFKVITEAFEGVDDVITHCELQGVTEADKGIIIEKIDDFTEKTDEAIEKFKKDAKANEKMYLIYNLIALGLSLLGMAIVAYLPIVGLISSLSSLVLVVIGSIKWIKDQGKTLDELDKTREKLLTLKGKVSNNKDKERIETLIRKVDNALKPYGR